jgi:hypothetical protein
LLGFKPSFKLPFINAKSCIASLLLGAADRFRLLALSLWEADDISSDKSSD